MVDARSELLQERADGRRYSRPTRRIVRLLDLSRRSGYIKVDDLIRHAAETSEFHWTQRGGSRSPLSPTRVRDYINFGRVTGFLVDGPEKGLVRPFDDAPRANDKMTDDHWTRITSQQALEFLQQPLNTSGGAFKASERLKEILDNLIRERKDATIAAIADSAGISGYREEEIFRWALLVHLDGEISSFELRFNPRVAWREQ